MHLTKQMFCALSSFSFPRRLIGIHHRLEEVEIEYGKSRVQKAILLARETPHDVFYWLKQLEYLEEVEIEYGDNK